MPLINPELIPVWLKIIGYSYLSFGIASAFYIVYDIVVRKHRQQMGIMNIVWPVTVFYLGPTGLWAYRYLGHSHLKDLTAKQQIKDRNNIITGVDNTNDITKKANNIDKKIPFWQSIFVSATHCGAGCTLGDIVSAWLIFLAGILIFGSLLGTSFIFDFSFAWILGIIFQYLAISQMRKISLTEGISDAIKADTLSLVAFEIGLFGWMSIVALIIFGRTWHANPTEPVFWFMMQIGMTIGFFTSYPANWWLVRKGIKHGM